mmetsp:Transcript_2763/g.5896  ORF Transcript_2763/g.5896 Transcript_2763/m.5896 type:complete len:217 (+) Transcript_2763:1277-1927(+)
MTTMTIPATVTMATTVGTAGIAITTAATITTITIIIITTTTTAITTTRKAISSPAEEDPPPSSTAPAPSVPGPVALSANPAPAPSRLIPVASSVSLWIPRKYCSTTTKRIPTRFRLSPCNLPISNRTTSPTPMAMAGKLSCPLFEKNRVSVATAVPPPKTTVRETPSKRPCHSRRGSREDGEEDRNPTTMAPPVTLMPLPTPPTRPEKPDRFPDRE